MSQPCRAGASDITSTSLVKIQPLCNYYKKDILHHNVVTYSFIQLSGQHKYFSRKPGAWQIVHIAPKKSSIPKVCLLVSITMMGDKQNHLFYPCKYCITFNALTWSGLALCPSENGARQWTETRSHFGWNTTLRCSQFCTRKRCNRQTIHISQCSNIQYT